MKEAIRRGCARATTEHPLRSSVVHPITRKNEQTSCGPGVPIINVDFDTREETVEIEMIPKGSGSENGSFLQMLIPADGVAAVKRFVIDKVIECGGRVCPPTIVGVGIGGTSDLCMHVAKVAATRPLGTTCADPEGAKIEAQLSEAVNALGIGPQGLGGRSTSFRVHVEVAATHITMNPVAVNIQCHSARRAKAIITPGGIAFE
jgi:tartrate/fumarate subfamily iron-sulfur-dependent hydro-lyase alpha chain